MKEWIYKESESTVLMVCVSSSLAHPFLCSPPGIAFGKVTDQSGRNFPLGSTWAPEARMSGFREGVESAFYGPGLKKDSPRKEGEKMVGVWVHEEVGASAMLRMCSGSGCGLGWT